MAGRPHPAQPAGRRHRQHPPRRVLHRQAVLARRPDRPARTARDARLRNAAACADEPDAAAADALAGVALLAQAVPPGAPEALGHRAARPLDASAFHLERPARCRRRAERRRLCARPGLVRAALRLPLPAARRLPAHRVSSRTARWRSNRGMCSARRARQAARCAIVDSSVERLQLKVQGLVGDRHQLTCNGRALPLQPTGNVGEYVAACVTAPGARRRRCIRRSV